MACRFSARAIQCGLSLLLVSAVFWGCFFGQSAGAQERTEAVRAVDSGESTPQEGVSADIDCRQLAAMIQQQKTLITRETGQLKREIAALRDDISKPGMKEIVAGIGYIIGLTGIALYLYGRRTNRK